MTERLTLTELKPPTNGRCQYPSFQRSASESEGSSVVSDSLRPHALSPGRNTAVGIHPFPSPGDRTQVSRIAGGVFTSSATREAQEHWSGWPIPSPAETQESNQGLLHCRQILYQLSYHSREGRSLKTYLSRDHLRPEEPSASPEHSPILTGNRTPEPQLRAHRIPQGEDTVLRHKPTLSPSPGNATNLFFSVSSKVCL